ncbi:hypothetical protein VK792_04835 [Mesobacterium sp. TK19101]|uniref:von Hippel-Lindau disease tumour suppressor beta domain-containing protein n=1 Tax=Mesobacterium hydrothermale TaxID=3111907 RepID=A0ABU6HHK3_9RHOB|nr:hypothetical protein [Mesobacterium sp. TK19101]MEC3860600.1 hypothetical protein [Mesobacterium sp. TK19101]
MTIFARMSRVTFPAVVLALGAGLTSPAAALDSETYGAFADWKVMAQHENGRPVACGIERGTEMDFSLAKTLGDGSWTMGIPRERPDGALVSIVAEAGRERIKGDYTVWDGMVHVPVTEAWIGAIVRGSDLILNVDGTEMTLPLTGTTGAIGMLEDCAARRGSDAIPARDPGKAGLACPTQGVDKSPATHSGAEITFVNRSGAPVTVYWQDFDGNPVKIVDLAEGEEAPIMSNKGHVFFASDGDGTCYGGKIEMPEYDKVFDIR